MEEDYNFEEILFKTIAAQMYFQRYYSNILSQEILDKLMNKEQKARQATSILA